MKILASWIGTQDLHASQEGAGTSLGPIAQALESNSFEEVILLANQDPPTVQNYVRWLSSRYGAKIRLTEVSLTDPTDLEAIHAHTVKALETRLASIDEVPEFTFHLSPGTWAMATVWTILSETRFPAELIQSSQKYGVKKVNFPFELSAELLPRILQPADKRLSKLSTGLSNETWDDLVFRSPVMERLAQKAGKAAKRSVPILIEGETGTEKELLARFIHEAGPRRSNPFVSVNCSALAPGLVETELFGEPESTPGVDRKHGAIKSANGGTLYLEEIESLSLEAQARLQKFIETKTLATTEAANIRTIDVRVIVATNDSLVDQVAAGRFREELFYSLAVLVLKLPPLRERTGDLGALIERLLARINEQNEDEPGYVAKTISPAAKNFLMQQSWPGNLRQLENTLRRAAVWSDGQQISEADMWDSVFSGPARSTNGVLAQPIENGIDLQELMAQVARHYIKRAVEHAEGNKTVAAKLVGLPSYQTLSNWMKKYQVM
jgi:DNA-binding NtrC family response regulator